MAIEAIIFDLDNTLVNRQKAFQLYSERFIDRFVATRDDKHRTEIMEYIRTADQNGYRDKKELYEELRLTLDMRKHTTLDELLDFWLAEFPRCTVLMEGAKELLSDLRSRGIKLGVITNGSARTQTLKMEKVRLNTYFASVIISGAVRIHKPDARIFAMSLKELEVSAANAWYVGDHPTNDIRGAMKAGLQPVWLKGFMDWDETFQAPARSISRLEDIVTMVDSYKYSDGDF